MVVVAYVVFVNLTCTGVGLTFIVPATMYCSPGYTDCTIICTNAATFADIKTSGCILGFNSVSNAPSLTQLTNTILTNAATVAAILGDDYRPAVTNWRYRYNGYGSAHERAVRDSMLESIRAALEAAQ